MGPDSGFLGVGHFLASFVADEQGDLPVAAGLFAGDAHLLHVKIHADLCLLLDCIQQQPLDLADPRDGLVLFVLCVEVEVFERHGADGLAVEGLDALHLLCDPPALQHRLLYLQVVQQGPLCELLAPVLEDHHAGVLLPDLEVLLAAVEPEEVDPVELAEDLLLFEELLELHKLDLGVDVLGQPALRYHHVLAGVLLLKLHDLPVVGVGAAVHVAELIGHLPINPA